MAEFNMIELQIKNGKLIDFEDKKSNEKDALTQANAIYIYRGSKSKKMYVGQTVHFVKRNKEHYTKDKVKFNAAKFDQVLVFFSSHFNGSVLDDVEIQLITYLLADHPKTLKPRVDYDHDSVINRKQKNTVNPYVGQEDVVTDIILPIWEKVLFKKRWVTTPALYRLRADAFVKYSPIKVLTKEQNALIREIVNHPEKNYVINGDAGTGKTVLVTNIVATMLKEKKDARIAVIVQPNWEKIGLSIFKMFGMDRSRVTVLSSTRFIKRREKYDVIIVDESHKMSRKYSKQQKHFNEVYEIDEFRDCKSHLEIIQRMGNQIILMYDVLQAIRPCNITRDMFHALTAGYEKKFLSTQFRIRTPKGKTYTSEDYINGIKYLLYKDTGLLDSELTNFNPNFNRELFRDSSDDAYFGYVTEQPLHRLTAWVKADHHLKPEHINRVLAGLVEKWKQSNGKDSRIKHWHEGNLHLRWNSKQDNWISSKDEDAKKQIGSVFAVQGMDLNKVGVLIGNDLQVDEEGKLFANPKNFHNVNGKFTAEEMEIKENQFEFTLFVLNIYYVLLTRGIDGIRLGFWRNDAFREYMEKTLEINGKGAER